jgi:hypothetical protein
MTKKWQHRKCQRCKIEYRPAREAQSYCSRECRRQAAYGRERFRAGIKGRRRRRLEASDKLAGMVVAGSVRSGAFSSIETGGCSSTDWIARLNQAAADEIDQAYWIREKRNWPIDLMGGQRNRLKSPKPAVDLKVCRTVLNTERLLKDEAPGSPQTQQTSSSTRTAFPSCQPASTEDQSWLSRRLHDRTQTSEEGLCNGISNFGE